MCQSARVPKCLEAGVRFSAAAFRLLVGLKLTDMFHMYSNKGGGSHRSGYQIGEVGACAMK